MVYRLIAIVVVVAINERTVRMDDGVTQAVDPMDITSPPQAIPLAAQGYWGTKDTYACPPAFDTYMNSTVYPELDKCLGAGRWAISKTRPAGMNNQCCFQYEVMIIDKVVRDSHCTKGVDHLYSNVKFCESTGRKLTDEFCGKLTTRLNMTAECQTYVDDLRNGTHPFPKATDTASGDPQSGPNGTIAAHTTNHSKSAGTYSPSTHFPVLWPPIVVSIAVFVCDFH